MEARERERNREREREDESEVLCRVLKKDFY